MKRFLLSCVFILFLVVPMHVYAFQEDIIPVFLAEYIDGKPTGNLMQFQFHVMEAKNKNRWVLSEITITPDNYDQTVYLQPFEYTSDELTDFPPIQNLKWEYGKKIEFDFYPDGVQKVIFTATKIPESQFGWIIRCVGTINGAVTKGETKPREWKASKTIDLLYKKVKFVNL